MVIVVRKGLEGYCEDARDESDGRESLRDEVRFGFVVVGEEMERRWKEFQRAMLFIIAGGRREVVVATGRGSQLAVSS